MSRHARLASATAILAALFATSAMASEPARASPDGLWRSQGYGLVAQVKGGRTALYDVTAATCVERPVEPGVNDQLFSGARLSPDGEQLTTTVPGALTILRFKRLERLPPLCEVRAANLKDPVYNFDVFWNTFNEHYAFFKERGVDWNEIRAQYRPRVTDKTTDAELIEIIREIYRQFQDLHVSLVAGAVTLDAGSPAIVGRWVDEARKAPRGSKTDKIVEYLTPTWNRYLDPGSVRQLPRKLSTGFAEKGAIGYVAVGSETAMPEDLDHAFAGLAGKRGLILDMRLNFGGDDRVALALAGLLTGQERPGLAKCARDGDGYTPVQHTTIHPRPHAFTGPVVLLISSMTWSGGENFAMMAKDFPNVVVVGDRTASVHSDTLPKFLPNGWNITLSNEIFTAPDGTIYETVGVPPDILVPYEPDEVRVSGVDPLMEKALHLLNSPDFAALAAGAKRSLGRGRHSPCP